MKSIRYILQSYFQQGFIQVMGLIMGMFVLTIISLVVLLSNKEDAGKIWVFFLMSVIQVSSVVVLYLREVTVSDAGALIPNYRKNQLAAVGLILAPFLLWPVAVAGIKGLPVLSCLAMLLYIASLIVFMDYYPIGLKMLQIISIWLVYELLGFEPSLAFIGSFSDITGFGSDILFALFVIGGSLVLTGCFSVRFLRGNKKELRDSDKASFDPFTTGYDTIDTISVKMIYSKMERLFNNLQKRKSSFFSYIRLYQYALFNPLSTLMLDMTLLFPGIILYAMLLLLYVKYVDLELFQEIVPSIIFLLYHLAAVKFTTEFLQHRDRIPSLWLQSRLSSRREFTKAILLTYLAVAGKQYIKMTILFLLLPLFVPVLAQPGFIQVLAVGTLPFIVLISFSLKLSDEITSYNCWGWVVLTMAIGFPVIGVTIAAPGLMDNSLPSWLFFLLLALLSVFFLWWAFSRWVDTEMNFSGPEFSL